MKDEHKTKAHLLSELIELRQRVAELEASQAKQVRSEEVLSKEDKFSELFRNLEEGVVINELILDEKGDVVDYIILEANSAFERQSPYKIEAVIGRRATDLYQMSPEYIRDWWRTHAELKEAAHTEMYHEPSDCWFHIVTTPLNERRFATIFTDISEPKRAQSALQESEEKFRSIMEQSVDGIVLADERGTIIEWNHGQERLTGLKKQEALGRPVWDVLFQTIPEERKTPDVYELLKASTLNFLETGQSPWLGQLREADIQRPDETRRSVQAVMFSIKRGKGFMSASISRDITEHKQTEYELRKLSLAVEQSNASIVITDITGAIEYVNPYFSELTGYTSEEALGKNPRILKSGYTSDHEYDDLWKVITKGQEWQGEFCNKKKNGELYWESASISPVMDSFGSITHFVAVKTDITERKQAELALQESEKKYRLLFEAANDSIFIMNADHILECNSKTLEMFGCQRKQIIGKRPSDFSPVTQLNGRNSREEEFEKIEAVLKGKPQFFEWQHCRLDKTLFDVEVSLTPLELDDKVFIQAIVRDMTKHKQTEIELRRRADEFAALYETSRDLTAQYDLPTLLNTIVERARALLHAEGGGIYLYDPAHNDLEMALTVGTSVPTGARLKIGEGMVGRVAQTRQALIVDDYQTWEGRSLQYSTIPFRAVVQSPMLYAGELIGVLVAHEMGESERKFTEADSHLLSLFAEYAASAVHAARLLQETRRRAEETTALLEISLALTSLDLETTLESIGKQAKALFLADGCRIFLLGPGGETLRCVLALQESLVAFSDLRIKIGEGVTGRVAASGQAEIINEMQNDPRALQVPGTPDEEEAIMFAPLNERDQTIGVISIRRLGTGHPFLPSDLELLKAFASMAASAVSNARLFEETQRQVQRLATLHTIDMAINSGTNLRITLDILLRHMTAQLGVDAADVLLLRPGLNRLEFTAGCGFRGKGINLSYSRLGEGYAGEAALKHRMVSIPDLSKVKPAFARDNLIISEGFAAYYAVPLIAKGQVKGVLEIFHRTPFTSNPEWLDYLETLGGQAALAIDSTELYEGLQRSNIELLLAYETTIEGWSRAMDLRDEETEGHTRRVTELTIELARKLGVGDEEILHLKRGGLLHDIGKMGVPDAILLKPEQLTEAELVIMRKHPQYAYDMLSSIEYLRPSLDIPYCHHEWWDGSGYPRGLKGKQIPLAARIFAVADVWDALTSNRPYRKAWPKTRAIKYIRTLSGKQFDPQVIDAFLEIIEK